MAPGRESVGPARVELPDRGNGGWRVARLWWVVVGAFAVLGLVALVAVAALAVWWSRLEPVELRPEMPALPAGGATVSVLGVDGDIVIPFGVVQSRAGRDVRVGDAGGGRLAVNAPVRVLGREFRVDATGAVRVDGASLVVEPATVDVPGLPFLDERAGRLVREKATVRVQLDGLPRGLTLREVAVTPDGIKVRVTGDRVEIPAP